MSEQIGEAAAQGGEFPQGGAAIEQNAAVSTQRADAQNAVRSAQHEDAQNASSQNATRKQQNEPEAASPAERTARALAAADAARWQAQAEEARESFPGLNLREELKDPRFGRLLLGGFDVATAYVALHHRELIPQAMRYAAEEASLAAAEAIRGGQVRPAENGAQGDAALPYRPDVRSMTRAQREDLIARARRGEKVRL